ncbi:MAG: class I SAM-dependent methyltransferase [Alphaproteobacteria bacterium]|nr:class I SAM-dependent methyltransferase [Alphaproteobacteria bacterium]
MTAEVLAEHQAIWQDKPVLRAIYTNYYRKIISRCRAGKSLEVGGGSGNLKEFSADVISTDIAETPWLDAVANAQTLPFSDSSFANIVMVDVLHHIEQPRLFLAEAERVLEPGGRLIMIEPAITMLSSLFFRLFHPEPVDMTADPLGKVTPDPNRQPFDSNQAIPTLLCGRYRERMSREFPGLKMVKVEWFDFLAYPLSGGFRQWSLLPAVAVQGVLALERLLLPLIGRWVAFRLLAVFEKTAPDDAKQVSD